MSILTTFTTPAFIQEPVLNAAEQAQLNSLWNTNVEGFTQQAITGDWNNLNSPIQSSYNDPTQTDIPAGTARRSRSCGSRSRTAEDTCETMGGRLP